MEFIFIERSKNKKLNTKTVEQSKTKAVLDCSERDSTEKSAEENLSNVIFVKCLLVITVACLLIGVVVRYIFLFENETLELKKIKLIF